MKKLIVFDIDGTLRDEALGIPPSIPEVLKKLRENGHQTAICTGRSMGAIQPDVRKLKIENIISGGGSRIQHKRALIFEEAFSQETMQQLLEYMQAGKDTAGYVFEGSSEMFMNQTAANILGRLTQEKCRELSKEQKRKFYENETIQYRDNLEKFQPGQTNIHKICVWGQPDVYCQLKDIIGTDKMELAQQDVTADLHYYEIIKKGCGKGPGVVRLCKALGMDVKDTVAFGDGRNDIDMFQVCGTSVAMANAAEQLFAYADSICKTPFEDGIYLELKQRKII